MSEMDMEMVAALREEVRHLRERQGAALAEIDRLTAALDAALAQLRGARATITELLRVVDEEKATRAARWSTYLADVERLTAERDGLLAAVAELVSVRDVMGADEGDAVSEIDDLRLQLRAVTDALAKAEAQVAALDERIEALIEETVRAQFEGRREGAEAIIGGSETPPSDAEVAAHLVVGGSWLVRRGDRAGVLSIEDEVRWTAREVGYRWWWLDAEGRPCARTKVTP